MTAPFFPILLSCEGRSGGELSLYDTFMASKPKEMRWFAYDVEIQSPTQVTFFAYEIRDSFHGGIGEQVGEWSVTVEPSVTMPAIKQRAEMLAYSRRSKEKIDAENAIVAHYAAEILAEALK